MSPPEWDWSDPAHDINLPEAPEIFATHPSVLQLVVKEGMLVAVAGIAAGLSLALVASRMLSSLLYDVPARDPMTLAATAIVLALVALAACIAPALRASKIDPIVALHYE